MDSHRKLLFGLLIVVALVLGGPAVYAVAADNARPNASFTVSPAGPVAGEQVTFTSTSTDPDGQIAWQAWDLDNDGRYDDGGAKTATRTFGSAGNYTIRLVVLDDDGAWQFASKNVNVKANGAPVAAFSASPASPETGETITLTSSSTDPEGRPLTEQWDLDNDGAYDDKTGRQATTSFSANGVRRISLRVTDSAGSSRTTSRDITVRNRAPVSSFSQSATVVDTGVPIDFTSTASDPDGSIAAYRWDFDTNGVTDATGPTARHVLADDGTPTVTLTVTDDDGASRSASRTVTVRNRAPRASITAAGTAKTGDEVVLGSTASDVDGTIAAYRWDLDGDGAFDDASGPEARTSFARAGVHMISLQVTDDDGAVSAPAFASVDVAGRVDEWKAGGPPAGPNVPIGVVAPVGPRLLAPFPRVRIRGVATRQGARVSLLSVRTAGGTRILVRCKGRGCPWVRQVHKARFSSRRARAVRIAGFRGRRLRAGAVIEIFVTRRGAIGKYTRFKIRRMKAPKRLDRCTAPGKARVRRCPA